MVASIIMRDVMCTQSIVAKIAIHDAIGFVRLEISRMFRQEISSNFRQEISAT